MSKIWPDLIYNCSETSFSKGKQCQHSLHFNCDHLIDVLVFYREGADVIPIIADVMPIIADVIVVLHNT